jgi:hypothetical protein
MFFSERSAWCMTVCEDSFNSRAHGLRMFSFCKHITMASAILIPSVVSCTRHS